MIPGGTADVASVKGVEGKKLGGGTYACCVTKTYGMLTGVPTADTPTGRLSACNGAKSAENHKWRDLDEPTTAYRRRGTTEQSD